MENKNIHEAIGQVMKKVGYVQKEKASGLNYTFAGEAALIQALRPAMIEHDIYVSVANIKEVRRSEYTTSKGTLMQNTVLLGIVRFTHAPSDSHIDVEAVGEGSDAGDKSANKALTGMYKYALRQTFMIETGDDPDKEASQERSPKKNMKASDGGPVTVAAWEAWEALLKRADDVGIDGYNELKKGDVTLGQLRATYKELEGFVKDAEEQAQIGSDQ